MEGLKKCKCGSSDLRIDYGYGGCYSISVVCNACGTHTRKTEWEEKSKRLWNAGEIIEKEED